MGKNKKKMHLRRRKNQKMSIKIQRKKINHQKRNSLRRNLRSNQKNNKKRTKSKNRRRQRRLERETRQLNTSHLTRTRVE